MFFTEDPRCVCIDDDNPVEVSANQDELLPMDGLMQITGLESTAEEL